MDGWSCRFRIIFSGNFHGLYKIFRRHSSRHSLLLRCPVSPVGVSLPSSGGLVVRRSFVVVDNPVVAYIDSHTSCLLGYFTKKHVDIAFRIY